MCFSKFLACPSGDQQLYILITKFQSQNPIHSQLADLSKQAHTLAAIEEINELKLVESKIDEAAAGLWSITRKELEEIQQSLTETLDSALEEETKQAEEVSP